MVDLCSMDESKLLTLEEALRTIRNQIQSLNAIEIVNLNQALGRVLALPPVAPINLPQHRNAAMDGYALASTDINDKEPFSLTLAGSSWAGRPFTGTLQPKQCIRIFTGALVPEGLDTVVMQEQVKSENGQVHFPQGIKAHQNVRQPGEDIAKGEILLNTPKKLNAADLGLLASAGVYEVTVKRRLKIAFFSTGNELSSVGQPLPPGKIYDSNRYMLKALLTDAAFSAVDMGVIPDDKAILHDALVAASGNHDVIITSGGASVGEADFIKEILQACGQVTFWKLAVKPGKPLAFGTIGEAYFFGLPGNPVAVVTTYQQIVKPALDRLSGAPLAEPLRIKAVCQDNLKKSPGRQEFMRGILSQTGAGEFQVKSAGSQGSHILSTMSRANCYIVLPALNEGVQAGDTVIVEPFGIDLPIQ